MLPMHGAGVRSLVKESRSERQILKDSSFRRAGETSQRAAAYVAYLGCAGPSLHRSLVEELLHYVTYFGLCRALTAMGPLSLVAVHGLLTVVASLLQSLGSRGQGLRSWSLWASLPHSMWDLPTRGIKLVSLHCKADSKPLDHQGNPATEIFCKNTQHSLQIRAAAAATA